MIVVLGPTACGKTKFAVALANKINGEIISADSRQVFRAMDIGTGKDLSDYIVEGQEIKHHLIDIREAGDTYSVYHFVKDFEKAYEEILSQGKMPILCGGTGLYISAIVEKYGFDANITPKNYPIERIIGLNPGRAVVMERIQTRLESRLKEGMIEEVKMLLERGVSYDKMQAYGLEYKYVSLFLYNKISYGEMVERLNIAIRQFAKRQMTWFRKMERSSVNIEWQQ